jgi:hypothetical protein
MDAGDSSSSHCVLYASPQFGYFEFANYLSVQPVWIAAYCLGQRRHRSTSLELKLKENAACVFDWREVHSRNEQITGRFHSLNAAQWRLMKAANI